MGKSSPTLRDVAAEAGVSATTVSRVLRNNAIPMEQTRQRVREAAKLLGYKPRRPGRRPLGYERTSKNVRAVAFLTVTNLYDNAPYDFGQPEKMMQGLQDGLKEAGYRMYYTHWNAQTQPMPEVIEDPNLVGIVVKGPLPPLVASQLAQCAPLVGLDNGANLNIPGDLALCSVTDCMNTSLRYLMNLGHRRIALLNYQDPNIAGGMQYMDMAHYHNAFMMEVQRLGLEMDETLRRFSAMEFIDKHQYDAAMERYVRRLMDAGNSRPTAILLRYHYAIGLVEFVQRLGWRIPEDLSIVGLTDRMLHYLHPPVTAYDWPWDELGRRAAELLAARIRSPNRPYCTLAIRGRMVERASCGPCPAETTSQ